MIFLIQYDKEAGSIKLTRFQESERSRAQTERLQTELALNRAGIRHEVVLLEAADENALRKTHSRYFTTIQELTASGCMMFGGSRGIAKD